MTTAKSERVRRRYDNARRLERAEETRERIITAAVEVLRDSSVRGWAGVTIRAVAERAGVHERTVYRHFANERLLHDAVLHRFEAEYGIDLEHMHLENVADVTARIFRSLSTYMPTAREPLSPTLADARRRLHDALLTAVSERATEWQPADRAAAAAVFDVLWSTAAYDRLVIDWGCDLDDAVRAITWVIGLVEDAIDEGRRPPSSSSWATATRACM